MGSENDLREMLARWTKAGRFVVPAADDEGTSRTVRCFACAHQCRIRDGAHGICHVRFNERGELRVPYGYVAGVACDPIEKKPFFHFLPGQDALSFGMLGCNLHCPFCQNWMSSQTLRDPEAVTSLPRKCTAEEIVALAETQNTPIISSTYNEPLITSEWAADIFTLAKERGLLTCYVSNGFASDKIIEALDPCLDAMNVDLKCFTEKGYAWLGGHLQPVLDTIRNLWSRGKCVEVITLVVPDFNDSDAELTSIAEFLASISPSIPWHVTAYHADYRMRSGPSHTSGAHLRKAIKIGKQAGLHYLYAGNLVGLGRHENTYCHHCGELLIERLGFEMRQYRLVRGRCPRCETSIPGRWTAEVNES